MNTMAETKPVPSDASPTPAPPPLLARAEVQRIFYPSLVAVLLIGLWQWWVTAFEIPRFLVPSPLLVAQTLVADAGLLFGALFTTLKITVFAFVCATVLGVLIAFAFVQSRIIETALFPYAVLLQVTPIVAIAPLIIIWVKSPTASLVICATLVALFPIIANTTLGLRSSTAPAGCSCCGGCASRVRCRISSAVCASAPAWR
jgi:NitT/TauT family transport system permease protein